MKITGAKFIKKEGYNVYLVCDHCHDDVHFFYTESQKSKCPWCGQLISIDLESITPKQSTSNATTKEKKLPLAKCPWCKHNAILEDHGDNGLFIGCCNDKCDISPSLWGENETEAVEIWNRCNKGE